MTFRTTTVFKCLSLILLSAVLIRNVSANSAQPYWEGTDTAGQIITEGTSPLTIESEELTFEIHHFPDTLMDSQQELAEYTDHVRAEYTLSNPSEYTVTAHLFFPFGHVPSYIRIPDEQGNRCFYPDTSSRAVLVDGQEVEYTLRHSYSHFYDSFDTETDLSRLKDEVTDHGFFSQDLPVHFYTFRVTGQDLPDHPLVAMELKNDPSHFYYSKDLRGFSDSTETFRVTMESDMDDGLYHVTVFGQEPADPFELKVCESGNLSEESFLEASVELVEHNSSTLKEELMKLKPAGDLISDTDWINAGLDFLQQSQGEMPVLTEIGVYDDLEYLLMRWIEYEVTLQPGQQITNTVIAPVYPSIDTRYDPEVFQYTYLLTPLSTWSSVGNLRIHLNTDFQLLDPQKDSWIQTGNGYMKTLEGCPEEELVFSLSLSSHPQKETLFTEIRDDPSILVSQIGFFLPMLILLITPIVLLILLYFVIHHWIRNRH